MSRFARCNCPAGVSAPGERHAPDCPSYSGITAPMAAMMAGGLSTQPHAGVDGLEVVGYVSQDDIKWQGDCTLRLKPYDDYVIPLCRLSDAQAIIDGLRGEVDRLMTTFVRVADHLHIDCEKAKSAPGKPSDVFIAAIDQQAQRVGELEGLLRDVRNGLSCENLHHKKSEQHAFDEPCKVLGRIDAALSAGKDSGQ